MIRCVILPLLVVFNSVHTFSQADTLNRLDSDGKKTGWWIVYLDEDLQILKDSNKATHCMYNYYTRDIYHYRWGISLGSRKCPVHFPENESLKLRNYTLLHGKYITKYENGNIRSELLFSNGYMTGYKRYYETGELAAEIIVSGECGAPIEHCLKEYNKDGNITYEGHYMVPKAK